MNTLHTILYFLSAAAFIYLAANAIYLFIIALGGRLFRGKRFIIHPEKKMISVLIPCFKEDLVIMDTAYRTAEHDYPKDRFTITIVADKLKRFRAGPQLLDPGRFKKILDRLPA